MSTVVFSRDHEEIIEFARLDERALGVAAHSRDVLPPMSTSNLRHHSRTQAIEGDGMKQMSLIVTCVSWGVYREREKSPLLPTSRK